jgi:hypothetical protein
MRSEESLEDSMKVTEEELLKTDDKESQVKIEFPKNMSDEK